MDYSYNFRQTTEASKEIQREELKEHKSTFPKLYREIKPLIVMMLLGSLLVLSWFNGNLFFKELLVVFFISGMISLIQIQASKSGTTTSKIK